MQTSISEKINKASLERMFNAAQKSIEHQKERERLKGENFNLFSVLKIRKKETFHTRFITEMLNPQGSHLKGSIFLELFLDVINHKTIEKDHINIIKSEYHLGPVDKKTKVGGILDIYIEDKNKNAIGIENKINAEDQKDQIVRYLNNNKSGTNSYSLYYLTINGSEPDKKSCGDLTFENVSYQNNENPDFYLLSYKNHIQEWLNRCLKECHNDHLLRENIRQYLLIIKKITYTMEKKFESEMLEVILENKEAAQYIANNYDALLDEQLKHFYRVVSDKISSKLNSNFAEPFTVSKVNEKKCSHFCSIFGIEPQEEKIPELKFGINGFTGQTDLFVGIQQRNFDKNSPDLAAKYRTENKNNKWIQTKQLKYKDEPINLNDNKILKIISNSTEREELAEHVANKAVSFINDIYNEFDEEHKTLIFSSYNRQKISE